MEIIGKFLKTLPEQSGQSQRGEWVRGGFVIETEEQFPKQVAFSLWGEDKVAIVRSMPQGTQIKVFFSPESREYLDKWYTDLRCYRIDALAPASTAQPVSNQNTTNQQKSDTPFVSELEESKRSVEFSAPQEDDDLPF